MTGGMNGQLRAYAIRVAVAVGAAMIALLSYLAAEVRADVRQLQEANAERRLEIRDIASDVRAIRGTVERIERKVGE